MEQRPPVSATAPAEDEPIAAHAAFHLPGPSIWPLALASGIGLALFGLVTTLIFSALGLALMMVAFVGWTRELLYDAGG